MALTTGPSGRGGSSTGTSGARGGPASTDVGAFLDLVTHDLRAPVAAVRTMVSLLSGGHLGELQPAQAELLGRIERRLESLQALMDDLVDLAAIRASWNAGCGGDACAAARRACERAAQDRGLPGTDIAIDAPAGALRVAMSPADLELVLHHLLTNAIKYGAGRGVRVRVEREDDHARVTVADRGIGIPGEALRHLFEPLFRAPSAREVAAGSGVGLLIVKEAVERCAGRIEIESAEGEGTTVTLRLPLAGPGAA